MQSLAGVRNVWYGLAFAGTVGIFVLGLTYSPFTPQAAAVKAERAAGAVQAKSGVMPFGYEQAKQAIRDPFAPPEEFQPAVPVGGNKATAVPPGNTGSARKPPAKRPELSGIVSGNGLFAAILRVDGESRMYRTGQQAGSYTILSIQPAAVELAGPGGNATLRLGR